MTIANDKREKHVVELNVSNLGMGLLRIPDQIKSNQSGEEIPNNMNFPYYYINCLYILKLFICIEDGYTWVGHGFFQLNIFS